MSITLAQPAIWILLTMLAIAAVSDARTGLIPNAVVASGAIGGLLAKLLAVVLGHITLGAMLASTALGFALCSLVPLTLYACGALGGGDLKLFAAIGVCVGPLDGLGIQLWAHVIAVAWLPWHFLRHGGARRTFAGAVRVCTNLFKPKRLRAPIDRAGLTSLRLAPAIFAAAIWVCLLDGARP